ncbi:MAG: DUF4381 domain-containing protein [Moritella sp.]|uniref:DUF4381 domain-containing protein n=1 Tax=Moritella sp. TaxID=78556 RepID=UPI0029A89E18|nr:DUF4381 domain-containing protein [Moritella sp.]MDX2321247.1 DUF4381 domain-containing protein [Moritella sp.]
MQHIPPSTYILRELIDVQTADAVSWWPGFENLPTGWWVMIAILTLSAVVLVIIAFSYAWKNRYRGEALSALKIIASPAKNKSDADANQAIAEQIFFTLKQVLFYIDSSSAKLADSSVLNRLDKLMKHKTNTWQGELGQRWIASLYDPNIHLTNEEITRLQQQSQHWIKRHHNTFSLLPLSLLKGQ